MKTNYMKDSWSEITRDERYFCAELYQILKVDKKPFLELLKSKNVISKIGSNCEIGYEVCFYRDYICKYGNMEKEWERLNLPMKRTFDLCLFFKNEIVIIEAKAQQGFKTNQLDEFKKDRRILKGLLNLKDKNIKIIALFSSFCTPTDNTINYFDSVIKWKEIYQKYGNRHEALKRADDIFKIKCLKEKNKKA